MSNDETDGTCVRCGERPAAQDHDCCSSCLSSIRQEVETGVRALGDYLSNWAAFREWERQHPMAA